MLNRYYISAKITKFNYFACLFFVFPQLAHFFSFYGIQLLLLGIGGKVESLTKGKVGGFPCAVCIFFQFAMSFMIESNAKGEEANAIYGCGRSERGNVKETLFVRQIICFLSFRSFYFATSADVENESFLSHFNNK